MNIELDTKIHADLVGINRKPQVVNDLFGIDWPLLVEPTIYSFADQLCPAYNGGNWFFITLSNNGFFAYPDIESPLKIDSPNGWSGEMSEVAFGISATLFAYSNLSFRGDDLAAVCAEHYHLLREFVLEMHAGQDQRHILKCID